MYEGKRILAVVPARGGSKGIKLKNLRPVGGMPMVARVGSIVREINWIDRAVVSTDHDEIARVAEASGLDAPFRRPEALSGDRIGDLDVLIHALVATEAFDGCRYEVVIMLQPTSPLRRSEHVTATIKKLVDEDLDAVWTVSETNPKSHPLKQMVIGADGQMDYYDPAGSQIIARQQLSRVYHRNGIAYGIRRHCLLEQKSIKGEKTGAIVLDGDFISIDTELDISLTEFVMYQNGKTLG